MDGALHAGAARRTIDPPLGIGKIGGRLFGEPIQAIESDLTATALVLDGAGGIPLDHVLLNERYPERRAVEATVALLRQLT
jgi:hypothetical protein